MNTYFGILCLNKTVLAAALVVPLRHQNKFKKLDSV